MGQPINVFGRGASKEGGVEYGLRVLLEYEEVKITAIRGLLYRIGGYGQVVGIAAQIAPIYRTAPSREQNVETFVHVEGCRNQVDEVVRRSKLARENQLTEVGIELDHKLTARSC